MTPHTPAQETSGAVAGVPTWEAFLDVARAQTASRTRPFLILGILLIFLFTAFDILVDVPPWPVLRARLLINGGSLAALALLIALFRTAWGRRRVYPLLFALCVVVMGLQVFQVSQAPARQAFHYLSVSALGVIAIQWAWPWQLALGAISIGFFAAAVSSAAPDFWFFTIALAGANLILIGWAGLISRWGFRQFVTEAQLREANRVKAEFLNTLSHEVRTPLNVIFGYSDLLLEGAMGPVAEAQREVVGHIRAAAKNLLSLIEHTLEAFRLDAGRMPIEVGPFELRAVLDELRHHAALLPGMKPGVAVVWDIPANPPVIETDQLKLKEIILNLVGNALKFTNQGEVRVSVSVSPTGMLSAVVADTGIGIPRQRIPEIFEFFRQLEPGTMRPGQGVGLGLFIVKKLVDLLGGTIEVDSAVGNGTKFRVDIPVRVLPTAGAQ